MTLSQPSRKLSCWSSTASGKKFHPFAPSLNEIDPIDIGTALSMQCRFNGHMRRLNRFYSVAEHSFYVSHIVSPRAAPYALLHDAPEAYIGDMVAPLKACFPDFQALENDIMDVIVERFGVEIDAAIIDEVHAADQWIVRQEALELHTTPELLAEWGPPPKFKPRVHLDPATFGREPWDAYVMFMVRFGDLIVEDPL